MKSTLINSDCLLALPELAAESIDACVTDPPYGLSFMGKDWDHGVPGNRFWSAVIRVLKPGAHLLAFGGTRTFHRLTCAIEDAGFEIRDCVMWVYGSGFPKSHNLQGEWKGWGTALKPAWEPVIVARKPLIGTVAQNVERFGTGAVNVDGCRIEGEKAGGSNKPPLQFGGLNHRPFHDNPPERDEFDRTLGRWPANLVHDGSEEVLAGFPEPHGAGHERNGGLGTPGRKSMFIPNGDSNGMRFGDSGSAARFFYSAKASKADRDEGCEALAVADRATPMAGRGQPGLKCRKCNRWKCSGNPCECTEPDFVQSEFVRPPNRNIHPTVKPTSLMRWLCRLVTPPGGLILDPFMGSGSTGKAAAMEGFDFLGIEQDENYCRIAEARIEHIRKKPKQPELALA